jgi:hypothetical protein
MIFLSLALLSNKETPLKHPVQQWYIPLIIVFTVIRRRTLPREEFSPTYFRSVFNQLSLASLGTS